jgi:Arc/MetJ-type ribon-helix-helix transcriptional regulator
MKTKVSISMEEEVLREVEKQVETSMFRNKSHFIELATQRLLKEAKDDKNL